MLRRWIISGFAMLPVAFRVYTEKPGAYYFCSLDSIYYKLAGGIGRILMHIALTAICLNLNAQDVNNEKDKLIEQILESLGESNQAEGYNPLVLDDLIKYSEKPLNINTATVEELERLNIIDFGQIQNILAYRRKYGYLLSAGELCAVDGLSPLTIKSLEPFISFESHLDSDQVKAKRTDQKVLLRARTSFPVPKGYSAASDNKPSAYPGIPIGLYSRYYLEIPGKLELGFTADQDAGEEFFRGSNQYGFDFYSGFISWQSKTIIRQLTLGDYSLRFGQGLNYWSDSGTGKSSNVMNIFKSGQGIRPYTSSDENLYFRGLAAILGQGPIKLMLFYSNKKRDANLVTDKTTGETNFTSLKTDGYHRTTAEVEDEKVLQETDAGAYAELRLNNFRLGALYSFQHFGLNMITGNAVYKAKSFSGNNNMNMGIDYQLALRSIQLFGEAGLSGNLKPGIIQGLTWRVNPQISWSLCYRYYDPAFHAFYGNPLSENTEGRNEAGIYTGVEIFPFAKIKISGYADFYHFPWLTYSTLAPENGRDFLVQVDFAFSEKLNIYLRGRFETKPQKLTRDSNDLSDYAESVSKLRLHTEWRITGKFLLKNRVEYAGYSFHNLNENGFLIYQDLVFSPFQKLNLWFRYAWFHTDGYNSRIYAYENDLLYSYAIPEFHGKGQRIYLNLKWQPAQFITTFFKAGYTFHQGAASWGSGNDLTRGNSRTDIRAELCLRF